MGIGAFFLLSPILLAVVCGVFGLLFLKRWVFLGLLVVIILCGVLLFGPYARFISDLGLFPANGAMAQEIGRDPSAAFALFAMVISGAFYLICGTVGMFIGAAFRQAKTR